MWFEKRCQLHFMLAQKSNRREVSGVLYHFYILKKKSTDGKQKKNIMSVICKNRSKHHTNSCFAELFISYLIGDVCTHQDGRGDAQFGSDNLGDKLQTLGTCIHTLEQIQSYKTDSCKEI